MVNQFVDLIFCSKLQLQISVPFFKTSNSKTVINSNFGIELTPCLLVTLLVVEIWGRDLLGTATNPT